MKQTVRDLGKLGETSLSWLKWGLYYVYVPVVLVVGIRTIRWENFTAPQQPI